MKQAHEWSPDTCVRILDWVELFYTANLDRIFRHAIMEFGEERVSASLRKLALFAIQKAREQCSAQEIGQFLAAVEADQCYDDLQQFCRQITECQRLWSILTDWGMSQYRQQVGGVCQGKPVLAGSAPQGPWHLGQPRGALASGSSSRSHSRADP